MLSNLTCSPDIDADTASEPTQQETQDYDIPKPHKIAIQIIAEECYDLPRSGRKPDHLDEVKQQSKNTAPSFTDSSKLIKGLRSPSQTLSGSGTDSDQRQSENTEPSIYDSPRSSADSFRLNLSGQNIEPSFYDSPRSGPESVRSKVFAAQDTEQSFYDSPKPSFGNV